MPGITLNPVMAQSFADLPSELDNTRRMIAAIPTDRLDFRPASQSWTLGELASHVVNLVAWHTMVLQQTGYDLASGDDSRREAASDTAALLSELDANIAALQAALPSVTADDLAATWTLRHGEHVLGAMPRTVALRTICISHLIHHRGQLSVYVRLVGGKVPGMYGPSKDDQ
jgi:uncharacterized damage-inducible protein DinB